MYVYLIRCTYSQTNIIRDLVVYPTVPKKKIKFFQIQSKFLKFKNSNFTSVSRQKTSNVPNFTKFKENLQETQYKRFLNLIFYKNSNRKTNRF